MIIAEFDISKIGSLLFWNNGKNWGHTLVFQFLFQRKPANFRMGKELLPANDAEGRFMAENDKSWLRKTNHAAVGGVNAVGQR
jgi:hypothetical protein